MDQNNSQLDAQQVEAAAGFLKQYLAKQQQVQATQLQPPTPAPSQPSTSAQIQLLNQLLGRSNEAPAPMPPQPQPPSQDSLSQLAAGYLKASQRGAATVEQPMAPPPPVLAAQSQPNSALPANLLAALQVAAAAAAPPAPHPRPEPPTPSLAAQLLASVDPRLAAATLAKSLTDRLASNNGSAQQQAPQAGVASLVHELAQLSQGAAATAQYRQLPIQQHSHSYVNHSSGTSPGAPPNILSAALSAAVSKQQMQPSAVAAPAPKPFAHQVSHATSSEKSSCNSKTTRAVSAAATLPKNISSSGSSALPSSKSDSISTGSGQPKPLKLNEVASAIHHHHRGRHKGASSASASAAPSVHSSSVIKPLVSHVPLTTLQKWSLEQLEAHVKQLQDASQTVSRPVALLLADMRRKEERRHAKRLANRRSASTSRARKKALIEEMTKENALLRRQAMILSYLPDPIVVISPEGAITFCSGQVERVLKHEQSGLIGANIEDIIVPSSRESIRRLIRDLMIAEQRERQHPPSSSEDADSTAAVKIVSEHISSSDQSFPPLLEVKYKEAEQSSSELGAGEDVSDASIDPPRKNDGQQSKSGSAGTTLTTEMSSLTHKNSFGPESSVDQAAQQEQPPAKKVKTCSAADRTDEKKSSDESATSMKKARDHLNKNVEMCELNKGEQERFNHKDDVMGASVTANNADAKLSSLMHHLSKKEEVAGNGSGVASSPSKKQPEEHVASIRRKHVMGPKIADGKDQQSSSSESSEVSKSKKRRSGNSSEDSGYRESNESPEESNEYADNWSSFASSDRSTGSDPSLSKKKRRKTRPLAPSCKVSLIRNDLTTIWCELTASIRTRPDGPTVVPLHYPSKQGGKQKKGSKSSHEESISSSESEQQVEKELLLCFRPFREGEKVGEELRFCSSTDRSNPTSSLDGSKLSSTNNHSGNGAGEKASKTVTTTSASTPSAHLPSSEKHRPLKKRHFDGEQEAVAMSKKSRHFEDNETQIVDEKSAIETMMELAKQQTSSK